MWTIGVNVWIKLIFVKKRGFVSVFLNSNKDVSVSGFSSFQGRILEWLTGLTISLKYIYESSLPVWILQAIDLIIF